MRLFPLVHARKDAHTELFRFILDLYLYNNIQNRKRILFNALEHSDSTQMSPTLTENVCGFYVQDSAQRTILRVTVKICLCNGEAERFLWQTYTISKCGTWNSCLKLLTDIIWDTEHSWNCTLNSWGIQHICSIRSGGLCKLSEPDKADSLIREKFWLKLNIQTAKYAYSADKITSLSFYITKRLAVKLNAK